MRKEQRRPLSLVLFFTRGVALRLWDDIGMLSREVALYQRLQAHDVKVSFITYGGADDLEYGERLPGIRILPNRWRLRQRHYERLIPFLYGPLLARSDVIKTNQMDGADVALRAARLWRKPLVARFGYMWSFTAGQVHGLQSDQFARALNTEYNVFSKATRVVATTEVMARDVAARMPEVRDRVRVIPNYVDTDRFRPPADDHDRDVDLIFVGRLSPEKNLDVVLEAISDLDVSLMVVGTGPLEQALRHASSPLGPRVQWVGNVPNQDLPMYLNRARIFVQVSSYEGHPKTLIEAMACGLPAIGADATGIREILSHNETGWVCESNAGSLSAAIQTLLAQPELRRTLGRNARRHVVERYSLDRILNLELEMLREVTA